MHVIPRTDRRHTLVFDNITDEPVIFTNTVETQFLITALTVTLVVDAADHIRPLETTFKGTMRALRADGTPGTRPLNLTGSNLNRLPTEVREAILTTADTLGIQGLREDLNRILRPSQRPTETSAPALTIADTLDIQGLRGDCTRRQVGEVIIDKHGCVADTTT